MLGFASGRMKQTVRSQVPWSAAPLDYLCERPDPLPSLGAPCVEYGPAITPLRSDYPESPAKNINDPVGSSEGRFSLNYSH